MVWLHALWHLIGVLAVLPDLSPATLVAGVAVAVLASAVWLLANRAGSPTRQPGNTRGSGHRRATVPVRAADPDARGRTRPRAPSR